ncbi:MAG TPA: hypothetical protein VGQ64_05050 [Candidatus Limnocylindrales bacterium]|jgi:hypothetical protein|nr:hypothetical protein [Candidatus Limnocylindrales bacterium]
MTDPLDDVLRLVAEGRLTADEAAPVIDALEARGDADGDRLTDDAAPGSADAAGAPTEDPVSGAGAKARALRIEVSESGRRVVNLRIPLALGRMAIDNVPGLSGDTIARIREALDRGLTGPIVVVDQGPGGDGVRIILE